MQDKLNFAVSHIALINHRMVDAAWKRFDLVNEGGYTLAFAEAGSAHYMINGQQITLMPGDVLFFQKGEPHTGWANKESPWTFFSIVFDIVCFDKATEEYFASIDSLYIPGCNLQHCQELLHQAHLLWSTKAPECNFLCRLLLMQFMQDVFLGSKEMLLTDMQQVRIRKAIQYIQENPRQTHSVDTLAALSGFSASYFSKLFKQYTGRSVINYQNMQRMNFAKDLIQTGDYTISEAAAAAGFEDIYYFSRLYKKIFGKAPSLGSRSRKSK